MKRFERRSRGRVLRPVFEWILLVGSLVAGLGVIGTCAATGSGSAGVGTIALSVIPGLFFAIALVGAIYLLTTMSRDLRKLRERYVDDVTAIDARTDMPATDEPTRADVDQR
jgi:hypothetical protein